ncbi:MAG: 3-ketoacyl-ACP reductase [Haloplasmataceae bacterium]|jgi:NAD(P)-dependent dehydrogenase (short-subunit alcohol dehydrogenase family)|nr:3-ketoacyl-ACP reductase [Haloplasmataceae bacterium]
MKKVAVVTGGTRGLGKAIVLQLLKEDYYVSIIGTKLLVENDMSDFDPYKDSYLYVQANIEKSEDRKRIIDVTLKTYDRLDVLVNNAGVGPLVRNDLLNTTEESFDFVNNINLKGTFFLTQYAANKMIELKNNDHTINPVIINIASMSSYTSSTNRGEYCVSKAGISMITKLFADRLAEYDILVYEVRPGIMFTDMTRDVKDKYENLINNGITPIKRWGQGQDVADAVSVLCSHKLSFSTGEVINVDGGFHLRRL